MKKTTLMALALAAAVCGFAQSSEIAKFDPRMVVEKAVVTNGVKWIDGRYLPIEGRMFDDVDAYYDRLPSGVTTNVNGGVRAMKHHTAGLQFRFKTDSRKLVFKWVPWSAGLAMDHMPSTGVSGIDVYRRNASGKWEYVKTGRIHDGVKGGALTLDWWPGSDCLVNLPLYNGVKSFTLGVDEKATVSAPTPRASDVAKPVVFYGTSITHGGCASRPGLAFVNVVGRKLDVPVVNLGFSGSGKMELEMSEHLARIDASCYVLDCLWNMNDGLVKERYEPFIRSLRAKRPDVPIVMAEQCDVYCNGPSGKDRFVHALYDALVAEGWKNLVYLPKDGMYVGDREGTVDGCHPNDWGMMSMADAFSSAVGKALKLPGSGVNPNRVRTLANDFVEICRSPDSKNVYCYTPGICRLDSGRLVVTCDFGGPGMKGKTAGRIFVSDDGGRTWRKTGEFPMCHARPFVAGGKLYVLGHNGNLGVLRSDDGGETWGATSWLTQKQSWHQSACNVWYTRGNVYLVMEQTIPSPDGRRFGWSVNRLAPTLMRAKETDDLTKRESWTFAESFCFDSIFGGNPDPELDYFGIPWYTAFTAWTKDNPRPDSQPRHAQPIGWLETNVVQFQDPNHVWYDPTGRTFHLFMRTNTAGSGYGAMAKVVEMPDGTMKTSLETAPSGRKMLFIPFPGGQMRFHVLWDEKTKLYWLLSTQATDTMCRFDRLPKDRFNLPYDERQRMQLSFSRNMMDWCFAGLVATGPSARAARHYASMAFDGDDLVIVSRSGDKDAKSAHDGNMITFHRVPDFRSLVY